LEARSIADCRGSTCRCGASHWQTGADSVSATAIARQWSRPAPQIQQLRPTYLHNQTRRFKPEWLGYDALRHNVLPFMIENQGVCTWALPLDEGDDPRVLVEVDSGVPPVWQTTADAFSLWLKCQVQDRLLQDTCAFAAQAPEIDDTGLELLRRKFAEGQRTYAWPGHVNYRFSNSLGALLLWNWHDQCDWWICPAPNVPEQQILNEIGSMPGLADALYELDSRHRAALVAWRQSAGHQLRSGD